MWSCPSVTTQPPLGHPFAPITLSHRDSDTAVEHHSSAYPSINSQGSESKTLRVANEAYTAGCYPALHRRLPAPPILQSRELSDPEQPSRHIPYTHKPKLRHTDTHRGKEACTLTHRDKDKRAQTHPVLHRHNQTPTCSYTSRHQHTAHT